MLTFIRSSFLDFVNNPFSSPEEDCVRWFEDGLLVLEDGKIKELGNYPDVAKRYAHSPSFTVTHYAGKLVMPGFIDTHLHYPQIGVIASYGKDLLDWLTDYVFPEEGAFHDYKRGKEVASFFLDELLRNGTTTAAVFATTHPQSVNAFFEESEKRNMRMISGKVMMSRHAPDYLLDTPQTSYRDSRELIERWHGKGRQLYAVTPRFAITCNKEQLDLAGKLKKEFPGIYVHTHISESLKEIGFTLKLFPGSTDYLDVYEKSGLLTDRSIFAHGIHLSDSEFLRMAQAGASIAFCPSSNLFLGSGLFNIARAKSENRPVHVGIGSDVGAGTSFSLLKTLGEAYKVVALQGQRLSALKGFYLLTLGGAQSLSLDDKIGNFDPGKEADFVVLNTEATPILKFRNARSSEWNLHHINDRLFTLMTLGDDRAVEKTYINGVLKYPSNL